jgi:ribonuclease BN (tRNA processing enzyme)
MKAIFLGTAGYHPNERRHTACLMLPEAGILLDAGSGLFRISRLLATQSLDIFLSHAHLDHVVGLTFLLGILHERKMERVTVHALPEKLAAINEHLLNEQIFPARLPCEMRALTPSVALPEGGVLRHFPLEHPGGSIGLRMDWPGHSMAYVTDTTSAGASAGYLEHIRGVDLLVHECYFPDSMCELAQRTGHSCATPVGEVAKAAGAKRLILTHINPRDEVGELTGLSAVRKVFAKAEVAEDLREIDF